MKCLVYCILRDGEFPRGHLPLGLDGDEVSLVAADGLAAAFSWVSASDAAPSLPRATAYAAVVEAFHARCTTLPLRYGCLLDGEARVAALLRERRPELLASLGDLDGCVEMSLRIADFGLPIADWGPEPDAQRPTSSGRAYLASKIAHYAERDRRRSEGEAVAERVRRSFEGLYGRFHVEGEARLPMAGFGLPTADRGSKARIRHPKSEMLTLHFLIRRESVQGFREAFGRLQAQAAEKVLLSGPWPPYNFAACGRPPAGAAEGRRNGAGAGCGAASMVTAQWPLPSTLRGPAAAAPQVLTESLDAEKPDVRRGMA